MVYAIASYAILGVNVKALAHKIEEQNQVLKSKEPAKTPNNLPLMPQRKGGFANSWR